ncbi:hypothetical protein ACJ72_07293 [Emergomyces africanus]|uniref:Uncharacterized protein n=1 Tax=Emergomyces africanus TaxID=1955775 RepID=A0A1B7NP61_9EURO|nr:hypothetical protein ACJ72_07293 [Emergomyces africanus]
MSGPSKILPEEKGTTRDGFRNFIIANHFACRTQVKSEKVVRVPSEQPIVYQTPAEQKYANSGDPQFNGADTPRRGAHHLQTAVSEEYGVLAIPASMRMSIQGTERD